MLRLDVTVFEGAFQENLRDWCRGGPADCYTRAGPVLAAPNVRLVSARRAEVGVMDALAKNYPEVLRWHIGFLLDHGRMEDTPYFQEYLWPRYGGRSTERATRFLRLVMEIERTGMCRPVFVAQVAQLPCQFFRFDGCHRLAIAHVLGFKQVPAWVFTTVERS